METTGPPAWPTDRCAAQVGTRMTPGVDRAIVCGTRRPCSIHEPLARSIGQECPAVRRGDPVCDSHRPCIEHEKPLLLWTETAPGTGAWVSGVLAIFAGETSEEPFVVLVRKHGTAPPAVALDRSNAEALSALLGGASLDEIGSLASAAEAGQIEDLDERRRAGEALARDALWRKAPSLQARGAADAFATTAISEIIAAGVTLTAEPS